MSIIDETGVTGRAEGFDVERKKYGARYHPQDLQVGEEGRRSASIETLRNRNDRIDFGESESGLREPAAEPCFGGIVGQSKAIREVLNQVKKVASSDSTVLLLEKPAGKELITRALLIECSRRGKGPLVKFNCAALPSGLIENELFGHERGAFTGAINQKLGRLELADHGTLFLNEVGDLPLELQPKLLRVMQEREFERLGSTRTMKVDVRFVAATHQELEAMVGERRFRSDLFYRLNVFPVEVLPCVTAPGGLSLLARYFVQQFSQRMNRTN